MVEHLSTPPRLSIPFPSDRSWHRTLLRHISWLRNWQVVFESLDWVISVTGRERFGGFPPGIELHHCEMWLLGGEGSTGCVHEVY